MVFGDWLTLLRSNVMKSATHGRKRRRCLPAPALVESLEDRTLLAATIYVDDDFSNPTVGQDPDAGGPATNFGTDSFATIQEAIDAVDVNGHVIVSAGTYTENLTLNKSITLQGAQVGVDARGRAAAESVITATSGKLLELVTGVAGSTIDGFTFDGQVMAVNGIISSTGPLNNLTIQNNRFVQLRGASIFLNDAGDDITVHQNVVDGTEQSSGGVVHLDQDTFDGFHFTSNSVMNGPTGFFVDGTQNVGPSASRSPLFQDNTFAGNGAGANFGRFGVTGALVQGNSFINNEFDGLQGGIQASTIRGNTFDNNERAGLRLTGFGGTADATRGAQNNLIEENVFSNNGTGAATSGHGDVRLDDQFDSTISSNVFTNNSFSSAVSVFNNEDSGEDADFSGNWWGTNTEATIVAQLMGTGAGDIDFTPFLDGGTDIGAEVGFQGDFSTLQATTLGAQVGATPRIQEAIDLVTNTFDVALAVNLLAAGDVTKVHIHNAAAGSSGTQILNLGIGDVVDDTMGGFTLNQSGVAFPNDMLAAFNGDEMYFNIHSTAFPDGEVRGQLIAAGGGVFNAVLDGTQEVPAVVTTAMGTGAITFNNDGKVIINAGTYTRDVDVNKPVLLAGEGNIDGDLLVSDAGANVSPGLSPGVIEANGINLVAGSTLTIEINGPTAGTDYDQLLGDGVVDITGAILDLSFGFTPTVGDQQFVLVENAGGSPVVGEFANFADGDTMLLSGEIQVTINYNLGGNNVVATVTNLPPYFEPPLPSAISILPDVPTVVPVVAVDPDLDPLTFSAVAVPGPTAEYLLDQARGFTSDGSDFFNYSGQMERWFKGNPATHEHGGEYYFILPNGDIYAWRGSSAAVPANGTFVANFPAVYDDLTLLTEAKGVPATLELVPVQGNSSAVSLVITPIPGYQGVFEIEVCVEDGIANPVVQQITITVTDVPANVAPMLAEIPDQMIPEDVPTDIQLVATDPDGPLSPLEFTAKVVAGNNSAAATLVAERGLFNNPDLFFNYFGSQEKWLRGNVHSLANEWYILLPTGEVLEWNGTGKAIGNSLGFINTIYYDDPQLLKSIQTGQVPAVVSVDNATQVLTIDPDDALAPGTTFDVMVTVTDGLAEASRMFTVTIASTPNDPPVLTPIGPQAVGQFPNTAMFPLAATDDGTNVTFSAKVLSGGDETALMLDTTYHFVDSAPVYFNHFGANEKWFQGDISQHGQPWYFILPNGEVYAWDALNGANGTLLGTVPVSHYANHLLLVNAAENAVPPPATITVVNPMAPSLTGTLSVTPNNGFTGMFDVRVTVTDAGGLTDTEVITITVA